MNGSILRVVLHPASSVVVVACGVMLVLHTSIASKVLMVFFGVLLYLCMRPGARRNNGLWRVLSTDATRSQGSPSAGSTSVVATSSLAVSPQLETLSSNCVVVSIPVHHTIDVLDHALAFGRAPETSILSLSTVMYICRTPSERAIFWLPLARLMLWMLGGLMEYSRGLLLQLLKRKAKRPLVAIVLLPAPVRGSHSFVEMHIDQKGIFAAALKTGATVVPAIVLTNGSVAYGPAIPTDEQGVAVPSPDQVRKLCGTFGEELVLLYKSVANSELRVH